MSETKTALTFKERRRLAQRLYLERHPEKRKESLRAYNASEKAKENHRRYYARSGSSKTHAYKEIHKEQYHRYFTQYYAKHADKRREYSREWYANNKERVALRDKAKRPVRNALRIERRRTDPSAYLSDRLRERICQAVKRGNARKGGLTEQLLGCSIAQLKAHLEALFLPGMTWQNRGQWHIDHIRPCASFDLIDIEQQRTCFHYTNLQPLWAVDNLRKHSKYEAL